MATTGRTIGKDPTLDDGDNLDLPRAAKRLGVSKHTLRTWAIYQRRLAYLRVGKRIVFRPADLAAFEKAGRVPAHPENGR
jgi:excisionase family DNA binding protein